MSRYVVWVEFRVPREHRTEFLRQVRANAAASLQSEAGCSRFDVLAPAPDDGADVALYEIYDSEVAFSVHLASAHYRAFAETTAEMVAHKMVRRFSLD